MSESYVEDMIYGIKDYIKDNILTYTDAINLTKNDGNDMDIFKEFVVGETDIFKYTQHPIMLFNPVTVTIGSTTVGTDEYNIAIEIIIFLKGGVGKNVTILALRYAEALKQCINADISCGNTVDTLGEEAMIINYQDVAGEPQLKVVTYQCNFLKDIAR